MHAPCACPAFNKACNKCRKLGHFAVVCRTKTKPQRGKVRYVRQEDSSSTADAADGMFIGMVNKADVGADKKWFQKIGVENSSISFMLDTGSDVNIISEKEYQSIKPTPKLDQSRAVMTSYSGAPITSIRVCSVTLRIKNRRISTSIVVVRDKCRRALLS